MLSNVGQKYFQPKFPDIFKMKNCQNYRFRLSFGSPFLYLGVSEGYEPFEI